MIRLSCLSGSDMLEGFLFEAEDGIRDLVRSRGLGDVYKSQGQGAIAPCRVKGGLRPFSSVPCGVWGNAPTVPRLSLIHI